MWGKKTQNAFLRFHCNNGYANTPQYYVTRILIHIFDFMTFII